MSLDTKTTKDSATNADLQELTQQLDALRKDMAGLADSVKGIASRRSNALASDIAEGFEEAKHYAERAGKSAETQFENSVATHPFLAVGLAAGAGLLLGAMSRR